MWIPTRSVVLAVALFGVLGCHKRKKLPKPGADAQVLVGEPGDPVLVDNIGEVPLLVAVGTEPPPDEGAVEIPVEPGELVEISLGARETLWVRSDGESWMPLQSD